MAANTLSLSSVSGTPQTEVEVAVSLDNTDAISALEISIPLGEHLQYINGSTLLLADRSNGHMLSAAQVGQELRIYVYNMTLRPLHGNSGELLRFHLLLGNEPGDYTLSPVVMLSDAQGTELPIQTQVGQVTILAPKLQILSEQIDYGHIPIRSTYTQTLELWNSGSLPLVISNIAIDDALITPQQTALTIEPYATAYVDLVYAPVDRGAISRTLIVTSNAINGEQVATILADPFSVNELHVGHASGIADSTVTIALTMNNMEPIVAMQCEFILPEELEYVANSMVVNAERSNGHHVLSHMQGNTLVLAIYSMSNQPLKGNDGEIATFELRLNGSSGTYYLYPTEVILSNSAHENMTSATSDGYVEIQSPCFSGDDNLYFGEQAITENITAQYRICNNGDAPLQIERATFLAEGYSVLESLPLTINPWEDESITVAYQPDGEGNFNTTMNLYTNDPYNRLKTVAISGRVYEPNALSILGEVADNGSLTLSISLDNYTNVVALQYDIHTWDGMTTSQSAFTPTSRLQGHSYIVNDMGNNTYRVVIFSMSNTPLAGNEGLLHQLVFTPHGENNYCDKAITLDNIVLSNSEGKDKVSQPIITYYLAQTKYSELSLTTCDQFTWNGEVYTESGTYTQTLQTTAGCDSIVTIHLTINQSEREDYYETACDGYWWNDNLYTESGDYEYRTTLENGCEHKEVLHLTINKRDTVHYYESACDKYYWSNNGNDYYYSGDYEHYTTTELGCERVEILHLSINKSEHEEYTATACDQYEWNGQVYTESGDYEYRTTTDAGCERVEVLHLTINRSEREDFYETACDEYYWWRDGNVYYESGTYEHHTTTIDGCERVEVLHLIINHSEREEYWVTACDEYEWHGQVYTDSGDYEFRTTTDQGCERVEVLHLTINRSKHEEYWETACDQYEWHGQVYTESGDYEFRTTTDQGCEHIEILRLTIYHSEYEEYTVTACDEYWWHDNLYTESGDYTYTRPILDWGTGYCERTEVLHLTINKRDTVHYYETACDSYYWSNNGNEFYHSGDYEHYTTNELGCERVEVLHLTINRSEYEDYWETACDQYEWHGQVYTESGDYEYRTTTAEGCERVEVLHLTVYHSEYEEYSITACDKFWWHDGHQYTESGDYTYSYVIADWGTGYCERTEVLHLTITRDTVHYYETACDRYYWSNNGNEFYDSGVYEHHTTNELGCKRVEILHLTINRSEREEYNVTACDQYEWHGEVYTESSDYEYRTTTADGCERVEILHLSINKSEHEEYTATACDQYEWNGQVYTESGDYEYRTTTDAGCERVEILHLTINHSEREEYDVTACDQYEWHGQVYTESGDYEYRTNATEKLYVGYDSPNDPIVGLTPPRGISRFIVDGFITNGSGSCFVGTGSPENGIVDDEGDLRIFDAGCFYYDRMSGRHDCFFDDFRYPFNIEFGNYYAKNLETGAYYFDEGNNVYEYSNTEYPLTLFYKDYGKIHKVQFFDNNNLLWADINAVLEDGVPMITIDYYNPDGTIYYTQQFTENLQAETKTISSCGRVEILHLTINNTQYAEETVTTCDNYTWNGETYTESGEYVYNTVAANGCDSIVTLHLTINATKYAEEIITACDSYVWNGETYTESGEYTYTTTASNRCDSIITLHLTINQTQIAEESVVACDSYVWNGVTYTESGYYTYTTTTEQGCERVEVLHLTILPEATTESGELALCPSELPYEWYGQSLTEEGTYSATEQYVGMECDSIIHELTLNVYVQTLPATVTLPIVRTGEAIDVTTPTAEIQAHIAAETWYAPNAEVAWYIMDNSDWAALSADPVAVGITEVTLKYVVDTDCGNVESDKMVINLKTTDMENTQSQSPTSNCQKILYEDHIYILREGKIYNAMGQEIGN